MKELTIFDSLESNEQYEEFVDKFKAKKTTDDCFTPTAVYEAVTGNREQSQVRGVLSYLKKICKIFCRLKYLPYLCINNKNNNKI